MKTASNCNKVRDLKFASQYQLDLHKQTHSEDKKYVCAICLKGFKQLAQFRNHSVTHMDKKKETVPNWFSKKQCELCDKFFADSKCLKKLSRTTILDPQQLINVP